MAQNHEIEVYSQPSLYQPEERTLRIYFSEPDAEVNSDTGILLFIAGYGGSSTSNVFKKMREQYADQYNMITVQCDYFGYEYMQSEEGNHPILTEDMLREVLSEAEIQLLMQDFEHNCELLRGKTLEYYVDMKETLSNFNDMGLVQSMDQLITLKVIADILQDNQLSFKRKKVVVYGFSHGAYLAYMMNALMPGVITTIIDNSAYLFPGHVYHDRSFSKVSQGDLFITKIIYQYILRDIVFDEDVYDLNQLYHSMQSQARVISFHGTKDTMTDWREKEAFLRSQAYADYEIIDVDDIDGERFKSCEHGLGADFLKLFEYAAETYGLEGKTDGLNFASNRILTPQYQYNIDMEDGIPSLHYCRRDDLDKNIAISVIVPCYNEEEYIDRCVEGLLQQTIGREKLELIFVDDASTDNTYQRLLVWKAKYPNDIVVLHHTENLRQGGARNTGMRYAHGEYIGFIDADDWMESDMYEVLYDKAIQGDYPMVKGKFIYNRDGAEIEMTDNTYRQDQEYYFENYQGYYMFDVPATGYVGHYGSVCTGIYKRWIIIENELWFPEKVAYEDNYWGGIIGLYFDSLYIVDRIIYHYDLHDDSTVTSKDQAYQLDRLGIECKVLEYYKKIGLFEYCHSRLEWDFLVKFYLNTLHIFFTRFSYIPLNVIEYMRDKVTYYFPDYKEHPRMQSLNSSERARMSLMEIDRPLTEEDVLKVREFHMQWLMEKNEKR